MAFENPEKEPTDTTPSQSPSSKRGKSSLNPPDGDNGDSSASTGLREQGGQSRNLNTQMQLHSHMAKYALKSLLNGGITVVEYGSQLRFRCGCAEVLTVIEYAVPDAELQPASQILINSDFPLILSNWRDLLDGIWSSQALSHDLDGSGDERVRLLPFSLVGLTLEDTIQAPSTFDRDLYLLTPKPPRYYLSLLHNLLRLPIGDVRRGRVEWDLHIFISQYIMHDRPADTPRWILAEKSDESYQQRVDQGVHEMKTWDWGEVDERMLDVAERAVREPDYICNLTDVVVPPRVNAYRSIRDS